MAFTRIANDPLGIYKQTDKQPVCIQLHGENKGKLLLCMERFSWERDRRRRMRLIMFSLRGFRCVVAGAHNDAFNDHKTLWKIIGYYSQGHYG